MPRVQTTHQDALTQVLAERHRALWDAYVTFDVPVHNEILADDFHAVHPNGTVHFGKPTAEEMAATPIEDYWLTEMQAWPLGEEAALVTCIAEVEVREHLSAARHKFAVGEVWAIRGGQWKCRYYHATMLKTGNRSPVP